LAIYPVIICNEFRIHKYNLILSSTYIYDLEDSSDSSDEDSEEFNEEDYEDKKDKFKDILKFIK
jgi:hypothetical protein